MYTTGAAQKGVSGLRLGLCKKKLSLISDKARVFRVTSKPYFSGSGITAI